MDRRSEIMNGNLWKYKAFITAVETGSFTKAAEILRYSQSAISRMVKDLEEEWAVTLLDRSKSGVELTSDGARLLPFIRSICIEQENLEREVDSIGDLKSGTIRIGATACIASQMLPDIIMRFAKDYPNIDYMVKVGDYHEIATWVKEGRLDCAILSNINIHMNDFESRILKEENLVAVISKDHPLADCKVFPMSAIEKYPFLLPDNDVNAEITEYLKLHDLHPDIRLVTWEDDLILNLVEHGFGITIMPELNVKRTPYQFVKKPLEQPYFRTLVFIYRSKDTLSLAVKRFMEYLP